MARERPEAGCDQLRQVKLPCQANVIIYPRPRATDVGSGAPQGLEVRTLPPGNRGRYHVSGQSTGT
jgi:hypothetical protein